MNVLQISESDTGGGAAMVARRIHRELARRGHGAHMLVGRKQTGDDRVRPLKRGRGWRAADRALSSVLDPLGLQYVLYPSSVGVAADPWFREADVVQLHNAHGSYFSISALPLLSSRRPVVWLLHDQWAFTGHVAYSFECERWRHGCGSCPHLDGYPALPRDTTRALFRWKSAVYRRSRLTLVSPSQWLAGLAAESPLLSRFPMHVVPNGVDLTVFRPRPRGGGRPVVLWVSADPGDRRKGAHLVEEILRRVPVEHELVTLSGASEEEAAERYAAADVLLLPSLADNLPNTAVESIASGTPVAAFDVGGVGEVVRDGETGLLAPAGDAGALAAQVERLLRDAELRGRLGARGREVAEAEYGVELQVERLLGVWDGARQAS